MHTPVPSLRTFHGLSWIAACIGWIASAIGFSGPCQAQNSNSSSNAFVFASGDRITLVGDHLIERENLFGHIETRLTLQFPDKDLTFRNLGWSADLPNGQSRASFDWIKGETPWFTNVVGQILATQPSVVMLGYGMAASFQGTNETAHFIQQMERLIDAVEKGQRNNTNNLRWIILSPVRHEDLGAPLPDPTRHNQSLLSYHLALQQLAKQRQARFVDLFSVIPSRRATNDPRRFTDNGIHLNDYGYRRIADTLARSLGYGPTAFRTAVLDGGKVRLDPTVVITNVQHSSTEIRFTASPTRLHMPAWLRTNGPAPSSMPLAVFRGLNEDRYTLLIDGVPVRSESSTNWTRGMSITTGPIADQSEELRQTILKKNELFFHRWRPQNSTYLFLFRKGEQGRNASEIPQFDPLIAAEEQKIATLRKPRTHQFELISASKAPTVKPASPPPLTRTSSTSSPNATPAPADTASKEAKPTPSFDLDEGLEINLYAENPMLYKPIQMNFDSQGRLWVASSSIYPQIKPGQSKDDTIIVLEDTDGDGRAEKSTVFADGLLIPSGVEPGDGGVYVGQSTELLFFKDTNGDGKADERRVVLSGFGTEDTHHTLHTLRWGMDGQLYMNQSIYIHTHLETPNGVLRLNSGGTISLRASTLEADIHMKGLVNSWGHHFDPYGQSFATDGAGIEGINYIVPQAMYFTYAGARRILGSVSPGTYPKFCSLELVVSPHFPDSWQNNAITCDFRAHRVVRFKINEEGSAYVTQEMPDVVRSKDATFRPIDVKLGPDGALYIADWSNPIIQHGEVDFRDPRRDKEHGRIWRVTAKGRPLSPKTDLSKSSNNELLDRLMANSGFHREKARKVLQERGTDILPDLASWLAKQTDERARLEGLWLHQSLDVVNASLLEELLNAKDGRIRAAAVRVLALWRHRIVPESQIAQNRFTRFAPVTDFSLQQLSKPLDLLAARIADEHPRVRLEALRALARFPMARAAELALSAADRPLDKHLEYALWLTINDLAKPWLEAVRTGAWSLDGREKQLEFALQAIEPSLAGGVLTRILDSKTLDREGSGRWIELIGQAGGPAELRSLYDQVLNKGFNDSASARALAALDQAAKLRNIRPSGDLATLLPLLDLPSTAVQKAALKLVGSWKFVPNGGARLSAIAAAPATAPEIRDAALAALRELGGRDGIEGLKPLTGPEHPIASRQTAIASLAALDPRAAIPLALNIFTDLKDETEMTKLWRALMSVKGSSPLIIKALPKSGLAAPIAKTGLRVTRESGRNEPDLVLALTRAADLAEGELSLTESELKAMAAEVMSKGDPQRGELVYRRAQLSCVSCHAIAGAGGKVGPDMTSIGASAPVDYLIESVWFPNRKVKEGFHSLMIETKDGQDLSGLLVGETTQELVLRNTLGGETTIAKNNIERRTTGGSLMPAGLIDGLNEQERLDLFRFLSELGKPGPFDGSKANVARTWKLRPAVHTTEQFGIEKAIQTPWESGGWTTSYAHVDGRLIKSTLQSALNVEKYIGLVGLYSATRIQIPKSGTAKLELEGTTAAQVWIDGKPVSVRNGTHIESDLAAGLHVITLRLDPNALPEHIRLKSDDGTFVAN